jgi:hypothetical protein
MKRKQKTMMRIFKKFWDLKENKDDLQQILIEKVKEDEEIPKEELKGYLDNPTIFMFIPKTKMTRALLINNFEVEDVRVFTDIKLKYTTETLEFMEIKSFFNGEYLKWVFDMTKHYNDVKIKLMENHPIWVETVDFICLLAPREIKGLNN